MFYAGTCIVNMFMQVCVLWRYFMQVCVSWQLVERLQPLLDGKLSCNHTVLLLYIYYCTIILSYYCTIVLLYNQRWLFTHMDQRYKWFDNHTVLLLYYCTIILDYYCTYTRTRLHQLDTMPTSSPCSWQHVTGIFQVTMVLTTRHELSCSHAHTSTLRSHTHTYQSHYMNEGTSPDQNTHEHFKQAHCNHVIPIHTRVMTWMKAPVPIRTPVIAMSPHISSI
jgi:hypothetical protein